jgi:hypothetical protein
LTQNRGIAYISKKLGFTGGTFRNAVFVFFVFAVFLLTMSLLTYPQLIYWIVTSLFKNNSSLFEFVKNTGAAGSSAAAVFAGVNNALLQASPVFRDFVVSIGNVLIPLVQLDNAGRYLVFQNAAAWVSVLIVLFQGERVRSRRYRKISK